MTIFLQFFRLSASFCPGAACPAVDPPGGADPPPGRHSRAGYVGIQHPHAAPVPHTKAASTSAAPPRRSGAVTVAPCSFCAAAKVQQPSLAAGISPQGGKALRTRQSGFGTGRHKCGMLPPPPAAPLQPAGQYLWQGQGTQPLQVPDQPRQLCILIPRDAKLIFPAGNLAGRCPAKSPETPPATPDCTALPSPPACNGGGCRISRCGNAGSGSTVCTQPSNSSPPVPRMQTTGVPAPVIFAPQAFKKAAVSAISGSHAATAQGW